MTTVSRQIFINAPLAMVWAVITDIRLIGRWRSKATRCRLLTEATTGLGVRRHLENEDDCGWSIEEVVEWEPPHVLVLRTMEANSKYDVGGETAFLIETENTGTLVTVEMRYSMPFGLFGVVMDFLSTKALVRKHLKLLLKELKKHVETGRLKV